MEFLTSSSSFAEAANAADLIQRRQRSDFQSKIKTTLYTSLKANPDVAPSILTLALNDIMTFDKATKTGGPNGSIRFSSEINRPENKGLSGALNLLEEAKKEIDSYSKGGPISYSDLIQLAVSIAIFIIYMFTSTKQTYTIRSRLYIVLCVAFFLEFVALKFWTYGIDHRALITKSVRLVFAAVALVQTHLVLTQFYDDLHAYYI